jgi:hypothetical protein
MKIFTLIFFLFFSFLGFSQIDPPVHFEADTANFDLIDFGGNASSFVVDPTDATNNVAQSIKTGSAELWAGTTIDLNGFANPLPFTPSATRMSVRVWSPDAGIQVRLKVEDSNDVTVTCETEATTTMAGAWETLVFDFLNEAPGTALFNPASTYQKASIFFNFGTTGADAGEKTYYWDDVIFLPASATFSLPVTFEADTSTFDLVDFGGNMSSIVVDPTDSNNNVAQSTKTNSAEIWAGTSLNENGFTNPIPFNAASTKMTVRVWSPDAGIPVRLKVENSGNGGISCETEASTTTAGAWEMLEFDFINEVDGTAALDVNNSYNKASIFFNFGTSGADAGEKTYYWDDVMFMATVTPDVALPVRFEADTNTFDLVDFGGNTSSIVVDPTDPTNNVAQSTKMADAMTWAGTTVGENGFTNAIPFNATSTKMTVRVWSPDAGIPVLLKVEDSSNGAISVETLTNTTMAAAWETLEFDFNNHAPGTPPLNLANSYNKTSIFFNFGTSGADAGEKTYYWDDVEFVGVSGPIIALPVNFEADTSTFDLVDFGGNASSIVVDPTDATNNVAQSIKTDVAELWAGTTIGQNGFTSPIAFNASSTKMTVRVWSPDAGIPIRLKVEDSNDPTISVETEANSTMAGAWETLEFDFMNEVDGTAALDFSKNYNKASIFFNFGTTGADAGEKTYYWDDVEFVETFVPIVELPVTFDDPLVNYDLVDFGNNSSLIVVDPTDATNMVAQTTKPDNAELWAGTTIGLNGFAEAVPFATGFTKMTVRVWSPDAGIPVRLKAEDSNDPTISVETEAVTTTAASWETLEFDFSNEAPGTAALNLANSYNKVSIFFNFGTTGADAGEKTYFWDDVEFSDNIAPIVELPVTFDDSSLDYDLVDFGNNASMIITDPTDATNMVVQTIKPDNAELWAGTTIGLNGFVASLPFASGETKMNVRVWSPDAGIPIRLKSENPSDGTISVETEATTTMAGAWETLEFDFSNQVPGTAAIDFSKAYHKVSIFFNFGTTGADAGEKTYYWDDVKFGAFVGLNALDAADHGIVVAPNPSSEYFTVIAPESLEQIEQISLYDINGQIVKQSKVGGEYVIHTSQLNVGTYFIAIQTKDAVYYQQVMIAR